MINPIDLANKASSKAGNLSEVSIPSPPKPPLDKLPKIKDPELLKKQAEADAHQKLADAKNAALVAKDKALESVKSKALGAIGKLPKPPVMPKLPSPAAVAAALAVAKKMKEVAKERAKASKENLTKSVDAFTYPIKPKDAPTIAKPSTVPKLPTVEIPKIKLPNVPPI